MAVCVGVGGHLASFPGPSFYLTRPGNEARRALQLLDFLRFQLVLRKPCTGRMCEMGVDSHAVVLSQE